MKYQINLGNKIITVAVTEKSVTATNNSGVSVSLSSVMFRRTDLNGTAEQVRVAKEAARKGAMALIEATRLGGWAAI